MAKGGKRNKKRELRELREGTWVTLCYLYIEILYQKSEIVVVSLAGLLFLILGTFYNNIIFQIILVIVFLLIVEFFIKIKLLKLFRLVQ